MEFATLIHTNDILLTVFYIFPRNMEYRMKRIQISFGYTLGKTHFSSYFFPAPIYVFNPTDSNDFDALVYAWQPKTL